METTSQPSDLSAMEFFILAVIARSYARSMYDLQQRAGLQPGGIRPAMQRLERMNLLVRAESAVRRRRELALTDHGYEILYANWRHCLRDYPDAESIFRATCVALLQGEPEIAASYLQKQEGLRRILTERKRVDAEELEKMRIDPLSTYAWMLTLTEARRRGAESDVFALLGQFLKEQQQTDVRQRT